MNKVSKLIIIGLSVAALAACAKKNPNADGSDASTGGLTQDQGFQYNSSGMRVNSLKAPSNQSYYFSFDGSTMRPEDLNALNIQAAYLVAHPNAQVRIEGNTDSRGSREYNIGLGWRRDQTVESYLKQQGVRANQIKKVSYGKERPVAMGENEHDWALNRRADMVYINK